MSTTTSAPKANAFNVINIGLAFGLTVVALLLVGLATIIGFNLGEFGASFWLGLIVLYFVGIAVYVMWWASHPSTKKWPGFIIGIADMLVAFVVLSLILVNIGDFQFDTFLWGLLDAVIVAVLFALILLYGKITRTLKSKSV